VGPTTLHQDDGPGAAVRVMVVDDHPVVRSGLAALISADPSLELAASVASGEQALVQVTEPGIDVVLMDLQLGGIDGVETTRRLLAIAPEIAVVVLTTSGDPDDILRAFDAGARGYVLKDARPEDLLAAIHATVRGESPMAWRTARALDDARAGAERADADGPAPAGVVVPHLSAREREVVLLLRDGLTDEDISRRLGISGSAVQEHLATIVHRLGVHDRAEAVLWSRRNLP
jgi:DNA-binding NarL/FixJ family response regulator